MFEHILNDTTHGSQYILIKGLEECANFLHLHPKRSDEVFEFIRELKETYPDMEMIQKFCIDQGQDISKLLKQIQMTLEKILEESEWIVSKVSEKLENTAGILTISYSHTVKTVLENTRVRSIYIMRSEPGNEGEKLHRDLSVEAELHLIHDDEAESLIKNHKVTSLLLGCDKFHPDLGFVNKRGTAKIVKLANENDIPTYVVTSSLKMVNDRSKFLHLDERSKDMLEIIPQLPNLHIFYSNESISLT